MSVRRIDLVVRGGTVVDSQWQGPADVWVMDGRVAALVEPGTSLPSEGTAHVELDATGQLVLPGGVDPHCHVGFTSGKFTSLDDHLECTTAAVFGGTTTIVDFAIPRPGQSPLDAAYAQLAKIGGLCDTALHACVVQWDASTAAQLAELSNMGVVTVKMFTTYRGESMADEDTILRTMSTLRDLGGMAVVHCEANHLVEDAQRQSAATGSLTASHMGATRPEIAETTAVAAVLAIAESVHAPAYFVHQSTSNAVRLVAAARRGGASVFSEAVTHHLTLDEGCYQGAYPERYVCCPPLRSRQTVRDLGRHVFNGELTTIGSDHCCYNLEQKTSRRDDVRAMPNGLPGVQTRLPVIFSRFVIDQNLPLPRFVELTSANPARLNGLYPRKGSVMPGADADLAIWDPQHIWTVTAARLHQATDYTPYAGTEITGRPRTVLVGGRVVVHEDELVDARPLGRFQPGQPLDLPANPAQRASTGGTR